LYKKTSLETANALLCLSDDSSFMWIYKNPLKEAKAKVVGALV